MRRCLIILFFLCNIFVSSETSATSVKISYEFRNLFDLAASKQTAIESLKTKIAKQSGDYDLHFVLGILYSYLQIDLDKANEEFKAVIKLKPDHYLSYLNLGYLTFNPNDPKQIEISITYFKKALEYAPAEATIYNSLATCYSIQGNINEARDILERGIQVIKNNESLYFNQSLIFLKYYKGQEAQEKVIGNMRKAIELAPREEYFFILGAVYLDMKNNVEAANAFKQALTLNPKNIYSILGLATTYKNMDQYEKALEMARKALEIDPDNKDIHNEIDEYEEAYKKYKNEVGKEK